MLVTAYDNAVLEGTLRNPRYRIAAKSGTALTIDPTTGQYQEDKFFHSFFGYFPASNPRFLILLFSEDPQAEFASTTLAPTFSRLSNALISYYAVPPDR